MTIYPSFLLTLRYCFDWMLVICSIMGLLLSVVTGISGPLADDLMFPSLIMLILSSHLVSHHPDNWWR